MSLFGSRGEGSDDDGALEAEIQRLERLTLAALAVEVMTKAFGPGAECEDPQEEVTVGGPNIGAGATVEGITPDMAPGGTTKGADERTRLRLQRLVAEGVQVLDHAGLIRPQMHTAMNELDYTPTRFGRKVLATGKVEGVVATSVPRSD
ncbi:MAG: hypothetical protein JWO14_3139 [Solirubrobacterales bacterium]|nr:hypothetical protein [Solirubrobacterales bacterium]